MNRKTSAVNVCRKADTCFPSPAFPRCHPISCFLAFVNQLVIRVFLQEVIRFPALVTRLYIYPLLLLSCACQPLIHLYLEIVSVTITSGFKAKRGS